MKRIDAACCCDIFVLSTRCSVFVSHNALQLDMVRSFAVSALPPATRSTVTHCSVEIGRFTRILSVEVSKRL